MNDVYYGHIHPGVEHSQGQRLSGKEEIIAFLKDHLYDKEMLITDSGDNLIIRSIDGVDLYSQLDSFGIDLTTIYQEMRVKLYATDSEIVREPWEDLNDSIGLSQGEVGMRKQVKTACRTARTAEDVVHLLQETYYDTYFFSEDRAHSWRYFNPEDYSIVVFAHSEVEGVDEGEEQTVILDPDARVQHISSSEDIHTFTLLDPPQE